MQYEANFTICDRCQASVSRSVAAVDCTHQALQLVDVTSTNFTWPLQCSRCLRTARWPSLVWRWGPRGTACARKSGELGSHVMPIASSATMSQCMSELVLEEQVQASHQIMSARKDPDRSQCMSQCTSSMNGMKTHELKSVQARADGSIPGADGPRKVHTANAAQAQAGVLAQAGA